MSNNPARKLRRQREREMRNKMIATPKDGGTVKAVIKTKGGGAIVVHEKPQPTLKFWAWAFVIVVAFFGGAAAIVWALM